MTNPPGPSGNPGTVINKCAESGTYSAYFLTT